MAAAPYLLRNIAAPGHHVAAAVPVCLQLCRCKGLQNMQYVSKPAADT